MPPLLDPCSSAHRLSSKLAIRLAGSLLGVLFVVPAPAAPLDPNAFASLGTLNPAAGTYTVNTSGTPTLVIGGTTFTGVVHSQGAGLPEIAVFTFDGVTVGNGVTINGTGSRPLAILSRGNVTFVGTGSISVAAAGTTPGAGGGAPPGGGPGGGQSGNSGGGNGGGGGGFGGSGGGAVAGGAGGSVYGDLSQALQAGSAGGAAAIGTPGGGGGGGLEIGAAGTIALATATVLDARGAHGASDTGDVTGILEAGGGGGSGGGLLLHADGFVLPAGGALRASGGAGGNGFGGGGGGGGGRITVRTDAFVTGASVGSAFADVAGGAGGVFIDGAPGGTGVARFEVTTTTVSPGTTFDFLRSAGYTHYATTDLIVQSGGVALKNGSYANAGTVRVEAGGVFTATGTISGGTYDLRGGTMITSGGLDLGTTATLTGTGLVGGSLRGGFGSFVNASDGALTIGSSTTSGAINYGGQFRVGDQTVTPSGGLVTTVGDLVLLDAGPAQVNGVIRLFPGSSVSAPNGITLGAGGRVFALEGAASIDGAFANNGVVTGPSAAGQFLTFIDDVTGPGSYAGNILFSDDFSPGNSPAEVSFGNLAFDATAELLIELGGLVAGTQFDMLAVAGDALLGGDLVVQLINGFVPQPGNEFLFLDVDGIRTGSFDGLGEGALVGNFGGTDLFITYQAGSGNDVALFAQPAAVPEPSSWLLLGLVALGGGGWRAVRRRKQAVAS